MFATLLPGLFLTAHAAKPRLPDEVRDVVTVDHPVEDYRRLELELLRGLHLDGGADPRDVLQRLVAVAVLYEDRVADVRRQTAVSSEVGTVSATITVDPSWVASRVQRSDLLRDHAALLGITGDCIGARSAWRLALDRCERGASARRLCALAASGVDRLGEPMIPSDAVTQLEVAAFDTGSPMGVCGTLAFETARRLQSQSDLDVAEAVLRELQGAGACSGAQPW